MLQILEGVYDGDISAAVLFDSSTERAFGPLFDSHDEAEYFLTWHSGTYGPIDPETVAERLAEFRKELERIG